MPNKIIYFEEARLEVKEAKAWYKKQQDGLQKKFAIAIKKTIIRVQNHPTAFAIRYRNIRIAHPDNSLTVFISISNQISKRLELLV